MAFSDFIKSLAGFGGQGSGGIFAQISGQDSAFSAQKRGSDEVIKHYSRNPLMFMVTNRVSDVFSSTNWTLFRLTTSDAGARRRFHQIKHSDFRHRRDAIDDLIGGRAVEPVAEHPMLRMIRTGNREMTGRSIRKLSMLYYDLIGEALLVMEKDTKRQSPTRGKFVRWFPVNPLDIRRFPTDKNPKWSIRVNNEEVEFREDEVLFIKNPDPFEPYERGIGFGHVLADEIDTDEFASKYISNFFRNGATPPILITSPEMSPSMAKRAEITWQQKLGGVLRTFIPYFMQAPEGTNIQELNSSFRDRQLVELRQHERDFMFNTFGVSPEIFGSLSQSNRSTIVEARNMFASLVVRPRLETFREALQERVVPLYKDPSLLIDYESPAPDDIENQLAAGRIAPYGLSVNEWRERIGNKPLQGKGGELFLVPPGMIPVSSFEELEEKMLQRAEESGPPPATNLAKPPRQDDSDPVDDPNE